MDLNRVKDTVRKIFDLAKDDAATEHEVENALRHAQKMMDKYHLDESDLVVADTIAEDLKSAVMGEARVSTYSTRCRDWESWLASAVRDFVGGVAVFIENDLDVRRSSTGIALLTGGKATQAKAIVFYGIMKDARLAAEIYEELAITIVAVAKMRYGGAFQGRGRSYSEGFVIGIHQQTKRARKEEAETAQLTYSESGGSTALVVIEKRGALIAQKAAMTEDFGKSTLKLKLQPRQDSVGWNSHNADAYNTGKKDGSVHSLQRDPKPRQIK